MKKELKGIDGKVAIHCTTQEEYTQVLDLIPMDAKKRESMNFGFGKYGNETCIADNQLYYGRIDFWKSEGYTIISAAQFIAMNTEPEAAPAWSFKTDEELKNFVATFLATKGDFEQFLSSLRKPAFELICQDGVVTDPEQIVWFFYNDKQHIHDTDAKSAMEKGRQCFISKSAAIDHRLNNTPAIKLSDMVYDAESDSYCIGLNAAHNLVNERIK